MSQGQQFGALCVPRPKNGQRNSGKVPVSAVQLYKASNQKVALLLGLPDFSFAGK